MTSNITSNQEVVPCQYCGQPQEGPVPGIGWYCTNNECKPPPVVVKDAKDLEIERLTDLWQGTVALLRSESAERERLTAELNAAVRRHEDCYIGLQQRTAERDRLAGELAEANHLCEIRFNTIEELKAKLRGAPDETSERLTGIDFLFAWMAAPNPQLGGVSPLAMLDTGLGHKVAAFIRQAQFDSAAENGDGAR